MEAIRILLVEDSRADIDLTLEALEDSKIRMHLEYVMDGDAAMKFLRHDTPFENSFRPDLILLDLNLPKKDGRQVLLEIKHDPGLRTIPVVILTTSSNEDDILRAYAAHANCFITKPVDIEQFMKVVQSVEDFWFTVVKLPR